MHWYDRTLSSIWESVVRFAGGSVPMLSVQGENFCMWSSSMLDRWVSSFIMVLGWLFF